MKNFVEELKWRGMLAQIMPGTEEYLQKNLTSAYLGTDPTADSLSYWPPLRHHDASSSAAVWPQTIPAYRRSHRYDRRPFR